MPIPEEIEILSPWTALGADRAKTLELELMREISPGHVLQGRNIRALAARVDRDDVLFEIEAYTAPLALVHLTWHKEENPIWPDTTLFNSWDQWVRDVLSPNHEEFTLAE